MEIVLSEGNFETEVSGFDGVVLVDFWAEWCGPCRIYAPVISKIAEDFNGRVKVGKVNVDENPALSAKFGIMGIPTTMIFVNGQEKERVVGYNTADTISRLLEKHLA